MSSTPPAIPSSGAAPAPAFAPARAAGPVEARAARRERLLLLCAVDRARLRLLWRLPIPPKPAPGHTSFVSGLLSPPTLAAILPWMPGKVGRWSRRIRTGSQILRTVLRVAT